MNIKECESELLLLYHADWIAMNEKRILSSNYFERINKFKSKHRVTETFIHLLSTSEVEIKSGKIQSYHVWIKIIKAILITFNNLLIEETR